MAFERTNYRANGALPMAAKRRNQLPFRSVTKCRWCRRPIERADRGRPRQYCAERGCRQRASEARQRRSRTGLRHQPLRSYKSDDNVMTPVALARAVVEAVKPRGRILDPCAGTGAFVKALRPFGPVRTCEISKGRDFMAWTECVDWCISNPPWSRFREFLSKALAVSDNIVFVVTVNHWWTQRRVREVREAGFGYRRLFLLEWPDAWPATGFQLGAMHLQRGYQGPMELRDLGWRVSERRDDPRGGRDDRPRTPRSSRTAHRS